MYVAKVLYFIRNAQFSFLKRQPIEKNILLLAKINKKNMIHDLSDDDIFQALREGSEEAFGTLFRRYYPRLSRFACKYIADEAAASDAVQTCFMRLWERRSALVGGSLQSMLYTMLRNECLNSLKHNAIVEGYVQQARSAADTEPLYTADFLGAADHQLLYDELQHSIDRALDTLPQRTADIFRMSRYESLKNREIAQQLGISTTAVEKHISKALKTIAAQLAQKYGTSLALCLMLCLEHAQQAV